MYNQFMPVDCYFSELIEINISAHRSWSRNYVIITKVDKTVIFKLTKFLSKKVLRAFKNVLDINNISSFIMGAKWSAMVAYIRFTLL